MKSGAVLINTARGAIVNEDAFYAELKNKRLIAAFDVFWEEPYRGKLLQFHPNFFFMTPHVASTCSDFLLGCRKDLDILIKEINSTSFKSLMDFGCGELTNFYTLINNIKTKKKK